MILTLESLASQHDLCFVDHVETGWRLCHCGEQQFYFNFNNVGGGGGGRKPGHMIRPR